MFASLCLNCVNSVAQRKGHRGFSITIPAPEVKHPQGSLGVDLGFSRVAVTSNQKFHTAKNIRHKKAGYNEDETISPGQRQ
jgi:hypothetical protein